MDLEEASPNKKDIYIIFVDLDNDNKEEAIVTDWGSVFEGNTYWCLFRQDGNKWRDILSIDESMNKKEGLAVLSASAFYRVVKKMGKLIF